MLAERVELWGMEREARGEARREAMILIRVLTKRFGRGNYEGRMEGASLEQLDMWLDRALDAKGVEEVFG